MKATTLIFLVLVGLGCWFLFNYLNKNTKILAPLSSNGNTTCGSVPATTKPETTVPVAPALTSHNVTLMPATSTNPVPVLSVKPGSLTFMA